MQLGTQIRLPDGRTGTVVYNSLCGVGIMWGLHNPDPADFEGTTGNTIAETMPKDWLWEAEAILRDPWPGCVSSGFPPETCVGADFVITRRGLKGDA